MSTLQVPPPLPENPPSPDSAGVQTQHEGTNGKPATPPPSYSKPPNGSAHPAHESEPITSQPEDQSKPHDQSRSAESAVDPAPSTEVNGNGHTPTTKPEEKREKEENTTKKRKTESNNEKEASKSRGTATTTSSTAKSTQQARRKENSSATSGAVSSTVDNDKTRLTNGRTPAKPSFLSRVIRKLVPCIPSKPPADPAEDITEPEKEKEKPDAKGTQASTEEKAKAEVPSPPTKDQTEASTSAQPAAVPPPIDTSAAQASAGIEAIDVVVPTPTTTELLPADETAGVTSGAVQPPGSVIAPSSSSIRREKRHSQDSEHAVGDESDGTDFTEDEDIDEGVGNGDEAEDEEEMLIMNGGVGIPIGPDGVPKPLLPPIAPHHAGRKCLVLDLDETLVHSSFKSISQADYVVPVEIEFHWHNVYVIKRPGVDNFLKEMGKIYEIVVFTASLSKYADPVLDKLDIHQVVTHRLFRESCYNHKGNYVKDLSQLGRPIADTIILDNSPASYIFHPNNAVPVSSWFNDPHDTELTDLVPFLADLSEVEDVRGVLDGAR